MPVIEIPPDRTTVPCGEDYLKCDICGRYESAPFAPGDVCPLCGEPMQEYDIGGEG